jgi:hypothetical protein
MQKITLIICLAMIWSYAQSQNTSIIMQHGDLKRTGWNATEKILNTRYVSPNSFGKKMSLPVDDQIYAQPLVLSNVKMDSIRNVVFTATVNNTVYAFDAETGKPLWSKNYTKTGMRPPKNTDLTGACGGNYLDFSGNMGIVGTPAMDTAAKTMYFVARSTDGAGNYYQYLHAIDFVNGGAERPGSPIQIAATYAGNGDGNVSGIISFNSQKQNQRGGLLLLNGIVYITYAAHCDWGPYHGWIVGYDASTLQQKIVYNTTPEGANGGVWMSGSAPSVDESGNIYVSVGNGSVGTTANRSDVINRGESALKLTPSGSTLAVQTFFTPKNFQALENADLDFGVTQILLVPNTTLAITGCKDGNIYVLNRDNMGGFNATTDNVVQTISLGSNKTLRSSLAFYKGSTNAFFYTWSENAALKAFPYNSTSGKFDEAGAIIGNAQGPNGQNGTLLSVSSDGSKDGTAILWASHSAVGDAIHSVTPGILRAFDANDVTKELWNSNINPADNIGKYAKFVNPTIANGKVYMATFSNALVVYGITDTTKLASCSNATNVALGKTAVSSSDESGTLTANLAFDNSSTTRWGSALNIDPQWIYVDLGARFDLCKISLSWEAAYAKDFQIQVSDDATNWTSINTSTGNTSQLNIFYVTGTGRYVRMYGTARATVYGYSLYDFQVFGTPVNNCITPANLNVANISRTDATFNWDAVSGSTGYNIQYKSLGASGYTSVSSATNSIQVSALSCGTDYLFKVQTICSQSSSSNYSSDKAFSTLICDPNCGFLPTRWVTQDIGSVGVAGSVCFENDTFRIHASGTDIWDTSDEFRIAGTTFSGNGNVTAKIDSLDSANPWNKCGVMFRETMDPDSRNAAMVITSGNGASFQYRLTTGGTTLNVNIAGIKTPYWVKMIKVGTMYSGYISQDGILWQKVGNIDLGFGSSTVFSGIGGTSHDNTLLSNSVLSNVPAFFTSDTTVTIGTPSGIVWKPEAEHISVYPNPADRSIAVELLNTAEKINRVCLTNISGVRILDQENIQSSGWTCDFESGIPAGFYILSVYTKNTVYHVRIVKNK